MLRRRIGFSAIGIGYAGVLVLEAALAHAGAGHAVAYGVFVAATGAFDLRPESAALVVVVGWVISV